MRRLRHSIRFVLGSVLLALSYAAVAGGGGDTGSIDFSSGYVATHQRDIDNVAVIEFAGDYNRARADGTANGEARAVVAREFYRTHPDDYDFLVVFTTFETDTGDAIAFHWGVQNQVQGIGLTQFDNTVSFGSDGQLRGYIDMAALTRYEMDPQRADFESLLSIMGHELMHQWAAFIEFVDDSGARSGALLGKDGSHWSDLLSTQASVLYGHEWQDNEDGTFRSLATRKFFSQLDLYVAGFLDAGEVDPMLLIESPGHDVAVVPSPNQIVTGSASFVGIDDIIAAEGPRMPPAADSQRDFNIAFVLLTAPGEAAPAGVTARLSEVARRFSERFTAWTGARARLRVATRQTPDLSVASPTALSGSALRGDGAAVVEEAIAWLRSQQRQPAGYWQDKPATRLRDTVVALDVLSRFDLLFNGREQALPWLVAEQPRSTDYRARRLGALLRYWPSPGASAQSTLGAELGALLDRQRIDGSWGIGDRFQGNALDTALVAESLLVSPQQAYDDALHAARAYLLGGQNRDGGWSATAGGPSRFGVTLTVLKALQLLAVTGEGVDAALGFVATKQRVDGGFGDEASSIHDTARAIVRVVEQDAAELIDLGAAGRYLLDRQDDAGSFAGSTYKTALAIEALQKVRFPNWRVLDAVTLQPSSPVDGDFVTVTWTIENDSNEITPGTTVSVFDGDPDAGGVVIAQGLPVPPLAPGERVSMETLWDTLGLAGEHTLSVAVDPLQELAEASEADNRGIVFVAVGDAAAQADLSIVQGVVIASPANPELLPTTLGLSAIVRNAGSLPAPAAVVRLYAGRDAGAEVLAEQTVSLAARSSLPVNFTHVLRTAGESTFAIAVDANDAIVESNEDNNTGTVTIETLRTVDLEVTPQGLRIETSPVLEGSDARFNIKIVNRGTSAVPSTPYLVSVSDGTVTTPLLSATVALEAGESVSRSVIWRANLRGDLTLTVVIDADNVLTERDETNNSAALNFTTAGISGANLALSFADLTITPRPALEGQALKVQAIVRNTGTLAAGGFRVALYDGDPARGGIEVATTALPGPLAAGDLTVIDLVWPAIPDGNERLLFVVADVDDQVVEFSQHDNATFEILDVLALADLVVTPAALALTPSVPVNGSALSVAVTVSNVGEQAVNGALLEVFAGDPLNGGVLLAPAQRVDVLANSTARASFSFDYAAQAGANELVVAVNRAGAVDEKRLDNNSARLAFVLQDERFFVSERYISPNGDGIADSTEFYLQAGAPQGVVVQVVNADGDVVRYFDAVSIDAAGSAVIAWDGLDERGVVVRDGSYALQVVVDEVLVPGEALVDVDNNRAPLAQAIGTEFALNVNLTCELRNVSHLAVTPDEQSIIFAHSNGSQPGARYGRGIMKMDTNGYNVQTLVPFGAEDSSSYPPVRGIAVSEQGDQFAYSRSEPGDYWRTEPLLFIADVDGKNARSIEFLDLIEPGGATYTDLDPFAFLGASREVLVEVYNFGEPGRQIVAVSLDGALPRTLFSTGGWGFDIALSPDRTTLAIGLIDSYGPSRVVQIDIASGARTSHPLPMQVWRSSATAVAWSPDSETLAVSSISREGIAEFDELERVEVSLLDKLGGARAVIALPQLRLSDVERSPGAMPCDRTTFEGFFDVGIRSGDLAWSPDGERLLVDQYLNATWCPDESHDEKGQYLLSSLFQIDIASNELELIGDYTGLGFVGRPVWDADRRAIFMIQDRELDDRDRRVIVGLPVDDFNAAQPLFGVGIGDRASSLTTTPSGRELLYGHNRDARDEGSICFNQGSYDYWIYRSLLNLTVDFRALRSRAAGGIVLQGTAADLNFESFQIDYTPIGEPHAWRVLQAAVSAPVVDDTLAVWVPPAPGRYLLRLSASDKAGNTRQAIVQVSWTDALDIADVSVAPAAISPNGDGVQDAAQLRYRVLQPVRLNVEVVNARGDIVRTIVRDELDAGSTQTVQWDGRNDAGVQAPDGNYVLRVSGVEFPLLVDRVAPRVQLTLPPMFRGSSPPPSTVVAPHLFFTWTIADANYAGASVERADLSSPTVWTEVADPDHFKKIRLDDDSGFSGTSLGVPLEYGVGASLRLVARDTAGNRAVTVAAPLPQQLVLFAVGAQPFDPQSGSSNIPFRNDGYELPPAEIAIAGSTLFLASAESVAAPIATPVLQFAPPSAQGLPAQWSELPLVLEASGRDARALWRASLLTVQGGRTYVARLRTERSAGGEPIHSNLFTFALARGAEFRGRYPQDLSAEERKDAPPAPAITAGQQLLFAEFRLAEPVVSATLALGSAQDPRYAIPKRLPLLRSAGKYLYFVDQQLAPCVSYEGRLEVTTESAQVFESVGEFTTACLKLEVAPEIVTPLSCDDASPRRERVRVTSTALEPGLTLSVLTLSRLRADGGADVIANINQPGGQEFFALDEAALLARGRGYQVTLTASNGESSSQPVVEIDVPDIAITSPREDERVCGSVLIDGLSAIPIVSSQQAEETQLISAAGGLLSFSDDKLFVVDADGEVTVRVSTRSSATAPGNGYQACAVRTFSADSKVRIAQTSATDKLFSPNADGIADEAVFTYQAGEALRMQVAVFDKKFAAQLSVIEIRNILPGQSVFAWNARDAAGALFADGAYGLRFTFIDDCANALQFDSLVEIDTTPPALDIGYPLAGDPLPLAIEVLGSITDRNYFQHQLDFGVGAAPGTWAVLVDGSELPAEEEPIALWNTFGLDGEHVLRLRAVDAVGNRSELRVPLIFEERVTLISGFDATPRLFSPNEDTRRERASLRIALQADVLLTLTVVGDDGVVRRLLNDEVRPAGALVVPFDGMDDIGRVLRDGRYTVIARATLAANTSVTQEEMITLDIDTSAPTVEVTQPASGFARSNSAIGGSVDDARLTSYVVTIEAAGAAQTREIIGTGEEPRNDGVLATLGDLSQGEYLLRVRADDEAQNRTTVERALVIDDTPPVVSLDLPQDASTYGLTADSVAVHGVVQETNIAAWQLVLVADNAPQEPITIASGTTLPLAEPVTRIDTRSLADGKHVLRLTATDLAANTTAASVTIAVDNTAPVVAVTSPRDGAYVTGAAPIEGTVADARLRAYSLSIAPRGSGHRSPIASFTSAPGSAQLHDWQFLPADGAYTLYLSAQDEVENGAETSADIIVDTLAPPPLLNLKAEVQSVRDAVLTWSPSAASDLAGYAVYRDGVRITTDLLIDPVYRDAGLGNGGYEYRVRAIDRAGLRSEPGNTVSVDIDTKPPEVALLRPNDAGIVSATVDIVGTAFAVDDFKEYRLYVAPASAPAVRQLLRASPLPTRADVLAHWDTSLLPAGVSFIITLEAEDLNGNPAVDSITLRVDNQPPAAPTGLVAVPLGADVGLQWNANAEADLRGYVVFRNGRIATAAGVAIGDLRQFAIADPRFDDLDVNDGVIEYAVAAIDEAGNLSELSAPLEVDIDTRAPHAVIVEPADGTRFGGALFVLASVADEDIAGIQFQYRLSATADWIALGSADDARPYSATLDPRVLGLSFADLEIRALATDDAGRVDPAPESVSLVFTDVERPDAPRNAGTVVDGADVSITWQLPDAADVDALRVQRASSGAEFIDLVTLPAGATSLVDDGLGDGAYRYRLFAVDAIGNESDASSVVEALVYTPAFAAFIPLTSEPLVTLSGSGLVPATVEAQVSVNGVTTALSGTETDAQQRFTIRDLVLAVGENRIDVTLIDAAGNRSRRASANIVLAVRPRQPTGLVASAELSDVRLAWDPNPEAGVIGYRVFRDGVAWIEDTVFDAFRVQVDGGDIAESEWSGEAILTGVSLEFFNQPPVDFDIELLVGGVWVNAASLRDNSGSHFEFVEFRQLYPTSKLRIVSLSGSFARFDEIAVGPVAVGLSAQPLFDDVVEDARVTYTVSAVNAFGLESAPSAPATLVVGDIVGPDAVVLSAAIADSTVSLAWTQSTASDIDLYAIYRDGEEIARTSAGDALSYDDAQRVNGTYSYTVRGIDVAGNEGQASNEAIAVVSVAVPAAPIGLAVDAPPAGSVLALAWGSAPGATPLTYRVLRALNSGGPYAEVASVDGATTTYRDASVDNGATYYYVIAGADALGNPGAASNEDSGTPLDLTAPGKPVIDTPTSAGKPFASEAATVDIAGTTEPDVIVDVFVNGTFAGAVSSAEGEQSVQLELRSIDDIFGDPIPSPDQSKFVYRTYSSAERLDRVIVMDVDTQTPRTVVVLTDNEYIYGLAWSPDSESLVYVIETYRDDIGEYVETGLRTVVSTGSTVPLALPDNLYTNWVLLSPNGPEYLVAGTNTDTFDEEIWLGSTGASTFTLLRSSPGLLTLDGNAWNADGSAFVYGEDGTLSVLTILDGESRFVAGGSNSDPSWSLDGKLLYEEFDRDSSQFNAVMHSLDTSTSQVVASGVRSPRWLGRGNTIAFVRDGTDLVRLHLASGEETQIAQDLIGAGVELLASDGRMTLSYAVNEIYTRSSYGAPFFFDNVALDDGDNIISAIARDAAGNASEPSAAILVTHSAPDLPDLVLSAAGIRVLPAAPVTGDTVSVGVTVRNAGAASAPPGKLSVVAITPDGSLLTVMDGLAVPPLAAGQTIVIAGEWTIAPLDGVYMLVAAVDAGNEVTEISAANNVAFADVVVPTERKPSLGLHLAPPQVGANELLELNAVVRNSGARFDGRITLRIEDTDGFVLATLHEMPVNGLDYGEQLDVSAQWNSANTFAGAYRAVLELAAANGTVLDSAIADFDVIAQADFEATVTPDRRSYVANQLARIVGELRYTQGNRLVEAVDLRLQVTDALGTVLAEGVQSVSALLPGSEAAFALEWNTAVLPPAEYTLDVIVTENGNTRASDTTKVTVLPSALTLAGGISLSRQAPTPGQAQQITFAVRNDGNTPLADVALLIAMSGSAGGAVVAEQTQIVDLAVGNNAGNNVGGTITFATGALPIDAYLVQLFAVANAGGAAPILLATASFTIVDRIAPIVEIRNPTPASLVRGDAAAYAFAVDADSDLDRVELRIDGGAWQPAGVRSVEDRLFGIELPALSDGEHRLEARAFDASGNEGTAAPVAFGVDSTRPEIIVRGVSDGDFYNAPVVPVVDINDPALASSTVALNGFDFVSGSTVSADGEYVLTAHAVNRAGNTSSVVVRFTLDSVAPVIDISGVSDGQIGNRDVTPLVAVTENNPATQSIVLNGQAFAAGTAIVDEGEHLIAVTVTDRAGNSAQANVAFTIDKTPPAITVSGVDAGRTYDGGEPYRYDVDATDADGDPIEYRLQAAPAGMRIDAASGEISFEPRSAGDFTVSVVAVDPGGLQDSQAFTLSVTPLNSPPVFTSVPITAASADLPYSYDARASDADGDVLRYSLAQAPAGMSIDAGTGRITWTPSVAGTLTVTVRATDARGGFVDQQYTITVAPGPLSHLGRGPAGASLMFFEVPA